MLSRRLPAAIGKYDQGTLPPVLRIIILTVLGLFSLATASAFVFEKNISLFLMNPRAPFQTQAAPPAPDYGQRSAWALWPQDRETASADIFYIHSTTYYGRDQWNADFDDPEARATLLQIAAPNEVGPFRAVGAIYAPLYRQPTLFAQFTHKFDGMAARALAFEDISRAFEAFLKARKKDRPFYIVAYGQGGHLATGLMIKFFRAEPSLLDHLTAVYIIDYALPARSIASIEDIVGPCAGADEPKCIVSFSAVTPSDNHAALFWRKRSIVWNQRGDQESANEQTLICINPLSWTIDGAYQGATRHDGAASATSLDDDIHPASVQQAIGAGCDAGLLVTDQPEAAYLRRPKRFSRSWQAAPYNLFYHDLAANAQLRLNHISEMLKRDAEILEPITESLDLGDSPVNKVPNE